MQFASWSQKESPQTRQYPSFSWILVGIGWRHDQGRSDGGASSSDLLRHWLYHALSIFILSVGPAGHEISTCIHQCQNGSHSVFPHTEGSEAKLPQLSACRIDLSVVFSIFCAFLCYLFCHFVLPLDTSASPMRCSQISQVYLDWEGDKAAKENLCHLCPNSCARSYTECHCNGLKLLYKSNGLTAQSLQSSLSLGAESSQACSHVQWMVGRFGSGRDMPKCLVGNGLAYRLTVLQSWSFDEYLWVLIAFFSCFAFITLWPSCPSVQTAVRVKSSWFKKLRVLLISDFVWVSWNLLESPSVFSPFSPEIFSTWLVECTGAPAMAHIADVPRQGPHSSDCSDSICMGHCYEMQHEMLLKCYERCWPCHKPVLPYYLYISCAFICLNDPQSLSGKLGCHCSTLRPEATQLATPESDYLAAWQRESGGFSHCITISWYVSVWLSMTMHYVCYESPGSR